MKFVPITENNFPQVAEIYHQGISTGLATFEKEVPSWEVWDKSHMQQCRFALVDENNTMAGWAALTAVSGRCVYAGVAEVSVYVAQEFRGKGVGKTLLEELIRQSEEAGLWTLQSGIFSDNTASIELHKKCGFRLIGNREKIGQINGVWKDNVIMEKRSTKIGV